jgi:hypothetical protein
MYIDIAQLVLDRSCNSKTWLTSYFMNSVYVWVPMRIIHSIKHQVSRRDYELIQHPRVHWWMTLNAGKVILTSPVKFPSAAKQYNFQNDSTNKKRKHNNQITFNPSNYSGDYMYHSALWPQVNMRMYHVIESIPNISEQSINKIVIILLDVVNHNILLGCDTASLDSQIPTFRDNLLPLSPKF